MKNHMKQTCVILTATLIMAVGMTAQAQQANPYFTGDGGKGIRLAVLEPAGKGLSKDDQWMLSLVQGSITGDFNKFSGMTIIDRQNLEKVMGEWKEATSGKYSDADYVRIGNLTNASHILTGNISKTANAIMIEFSVTDLQSGERKASYSPKPVSALALENLSAVKEAAADLLRQLGVELTSAALAELKQTENIAKIQAETMLARGITAQRQGTEVAALSYFFQAAILDPSLVEAVNRSSVMAANISSGNIGADARNDIAWRKAWVERLTEAEKYFDNLNKTVSMPYTLYYSDDIIQGDINYQNETMSLTIKTNLQGGSSIRAWALSVERALQAVYDGLEATKRKDAWGLNKWPSQCLTYLNPFTKQSRTFTIVVELVNSKNKVIGRQEFITGGYWEYNVKWRPSVRAYTDEHKDVKFTNVKADEITDNLTIRFASVNGEAAETAARKGVLQIKVKRKGELFTFTDNRDGKKYNAINIGTQTWMSENLNYAAGGSKCYDNNAGNCAKYGRLYNWDTAKEACPVGWSLPSDGDWTALENSVGGKSTAGTKLKSTNGWTNNRNGTDDYGWSALPGGSGYSDGSFDPAGNDGIWWSATENGANYAGGRYMDYNGEYVYWLNYSKTNLFSVRCVAD